MAITFQLTTTASSATYPFTVGLVFKKGDIPDNPALNCAGWQNVVKRRWSDNSVKHAIVSGRAALTQNVASTITVTNSVSTSSGGASLITADIEAAAPDASVDCPGFGTVNLSSLLASPFRTWVSGPEMIEAHYRSAVGSDTSLVVWFYVRLYVDGRMWIRIILENGYMNATTTSRGFVPTITIDGSTIYTFAQRTITNIIQNDLGSNQYDETVTSPAHNLPLNSNVFVAGVNGMTEMNGVRYVRLILDANTFRTAIHSNPWGTYTSGGTIDFPAPAFARCTWEGWINGDPQITPKHDATYLMDTKLVPNYWKRNPKAAALNNLKQTYIPHNRGDLTQLMGGVGFMNQIGLLPLWDSLYCTSTDPRAYRAMLLNSTSMNSYPICRRDVNTNLPPRPTDHPTFTYATFNLSAGGLVWEMNHAPSEGYLAYMMTGDYFHYETMLFNAAINYMARNFNTGTGVNRILTAETRGLGWNLRTLSQLTAIAPAGDTVAADYTTLLVNNITNFRNIVVNTLGGVGLGYVYSDGAFGPGLYAPWMGAYITAPIGMAYDIECLSDMTDLVTLRDFLYKAVVGMMGTYPGGYCFNEASRNTIRIGTTSATNSPTTWFTDWETVYVETFAPSSPPACTNTLAGNSAAHPTEASQGYWGYQETCPLPYAVDHGAPGAAAAYARLTGASNYSVFETGQVNPDFDDCPIWGLTPRTQETPPTPTLLALVRT